MHIERNINSIIAIMIMVLTSCSQVKGQISSTQVNDELGTRIKMASERLVFGKEPEITEDFLLACITLDPKFSRRFTEYSGDQCGRYLSTFSRITVKGNPIDLHNLVKKIVATQKPDGRFGNAELIFDPTKLTGNHMALLWGNGRLLTGLMDYYAVSKNREALMAAEKLGRFLTGVAQSCMRPKIIEKFKTMGAMGFICFTQITDGLVKLYVQTSDQKYLALAGSIYKLLPAFGNQHSHGYLNTVLGVMGLYKATKDTIHLNFAKHIYQQVVSSSNYLISGGVPEYFGEHSPNNCRDEGCSEADFMMLSLELWKATHKMDYLDRAEYCLFNELMFNQFNSGDFGSHNIDEKSGFSAAHSQGRCWWCCDYHGLQAMIEAGNSIVTVQNGAKQLNLYCCTKYKDADIAFTLLKATGNEAIYNLEIDSCGNSEQVLALRTPSWSARTSVLMNGKETIVKPENGYVHLKQVWKKGDRLTINLIYKLQLITFDRKSLSFAEMPEKLTKAALRYGPYLMAVDDIYSTPFMAEPSDGNIIYLQEKDLVAGKVEKARAPLTSNLGEAYLQFDYKHEGYYAIGKVKMRPMSEVTYGPLPNVQLWFNFEKK